MVYREYPARGLIVLSKKKTRVNIVRSSHWREKHIDSPPVVPWHQLVVCINRISSLLFVGCILEQCVQNVQYSAILDFFSDALGKSAKHQPANKYERQASSENDEEIVLGRR